LVLCGLALARKREILAGVFAALTFIEPSVAVPVVAATLLFVPRARWAVIVTGSLLAIAALALVGWGTLVTYATGVIPAQAAAEVYFPFEYSLTYALAALGLGQSAAGFAGELSYLILLAVGLFLAPRASAAFERRELVVFLPALSSVIAGSYLHQEELCFALPALLVMAVYARPRVRVVLALALCALAVPWILVWGAKQLLLASLFVCAVILLRLRIDLRVALASLGVITALIYGFELHPPHLPVPMAAQRHYASNELVQVEWREYAQERSTHDLLWFAIKLPTWAGLLAGLGVAFAVRKG
jgi:hypothetical protein